MKLSNIFFSLLLTWLALVGFISGVTCRKVDGIHGDPTLIVDALHQVVSSLEDTLQALESREDIRLSGIISSLNFINANREKLVMGRKALQDLPYNAPFHILESNEYLQGHQHVMDILKPYIYGVSLAANGIIEDKLLLQKLGQLISQIKDSKMTFNELMNSLSLNQFEVTKDYPEALKLMHSKLHNLDKAVSSVAKRMESLKCKLGLSFAGVNFMRNFLEEATIWSRRRTLETSI